MIEIKALFFLCFCFTTAFAATTLNSTINPSLVPATLRSQWCQGQLQTCGTLCSGDVGQNTCTPDTLAFSCTCAINSSSPDLYSYTSTMPTFICEQIYTNCLAASQNPTGQAQCQANEKVNCGHANPNTIGGQPAEIASASTSSLVPAASTGTLLSVAQTRSTRTTTLVTTVVKTTSSQGSSTSSGASKSSSSAGSITSSEAVATAANSISSPVRSTSTFMVPIPTDPSISPYVQQTSASKGLNLAAKIGIGIAAALLLLTLGGGGYWLGMKRERMRRSKEKEGHRASELSAHTLFEVPQLEAREKPSELGTGDTGFVGRFQVQRGRGELEG